MQLRGVVRLFSRCVASRKANNDHPNPLHHMISSPKLENVSHASVDNNPPSVVATIFKVPKANCRASPLVVIRQERFLMGLKEAGGVSNVP